MWILSCNCQIKEKKEEMREFSIVEEFCDICHKELHSHQWRITPIGGLTYCQECWILKQTYHPTVMDYNTKKMMLDELLPKIDDIEIDSFSYTIDNHLDQFGTRTRAQTIDIQYRLKDGRFVSVHIE